MKACQTEFPLRVAVCAWCAPGHRGGAISHGICPHHLEELRQEMRKASAESVPRIHRKSRRSARKPAQLALAL
jgi:hypothetical protein